MSAQDRSSSEKAHAEAAASCKDTRALILPLDVSRGSQAAQTVCSPCMRSWLSASVNRTSEAALVCWMNNHVDCWVEKEARRNPE